MPIADGLKCRLLFAYLPNDLIFSAQLEGEFSSGAELELGKTDLVILQIADSAFPTGAFAHSGGVEAARQTGWIADAEAFEGYLKVQLGQLGVTALAFVRAAHREPSRLGEIDSICEAFLSNHVARRASAAQGRAFALACDKAFGRVECTEVLRQIRRREIAGHYSPVFGAVLAGLGVDLLDTSKLFAFVSLRGWISAAVRLGVMGPLEAQRMQWRLAEDLESTACKGAEEEGSAVQTAPVLDLIQGMHDRLYTRLFQS